MSTKTALCVDKIGFGLSGRQTRGGFARVCPQKQPSAWTKSDSGSDHYGVVAQKSRYRRDAQKSRDRRAIMEQVKRQWGGRREGAGRKKKGEATTVGFRINPEVAEALVAEAKRLGVTRSSIVENALRAYLSLDH